MKISKSKSNDKTPQNPFNFDSIKNSFWVHIDTGIRILFTKFYKTLSSKMLTLLHLPSPLWKFLSPNVTEKKNKNPFNFDSIKNSFWVYNVSGIKILFPNFNKKLSSGFWKNASKCNSKHPSPPPPPKKKNPFNFDSIQKSFWAHKVAGIKILFPNFHKKLSSGFWKKLTSLHLPYENF